MLIKQKLILGSLMVALFNILVVSIVLIYTTKNLDTALQQTNRYNVINANVREAMIEEKNYFLFRKKTIDSNNPYLEKFKLALSTAEESAKNDKNIKSLIDNYANYFEEIIVNGNINDESTKTLEMRAGTLKKCASDKFEYAQKRAESTQKRVYSSLLIGFFIIGGVSIGGGIFLSRLVTVPLKGLLDNAKKFSEGAVDTKIEVTTQDEIGNLGYVVNGIIENLNQTKQEFERQNKDLETKIDEYSKNLKDQQENIIQFEKTAAIEQFGNAIFLGFKTYLNTIKSLFDQLRARIVKDDKEINLYVKNIDEEINKITRINANILRYSKIPVLNFESINVNNVIEELLSLKGKEKNWENIKVVRRLSSNIPQIPLDAHQIRQVFDNLFTNACESMSQGGELIVTSNIGVEEVEIKITDAGSGIIRENLGKIFTPFFSTKSEGIGLGLTVVKEIISQHRGNIAVQSSVEKGTTFIIKLPVSQKQK